MRLVIFVAALLLVSNHSAEARMHKERHYAGGVRCAHTLLCGSPEALKHQNDVANEEGLERFQNEWDLAMAKVDGRLVLLPDNLLVDLDDRLPVAYRWCRPWTQDFLNDTGKLYFEKFKMRFQVNSGVRTVEYQKLLRKRNGNAAPFEGDEASSHLTGATVDITKKGMTPLQIQWMRNYLVMLEEKDFIDATEEFSQSVFHIMVFRKYTDIYNPK